MKVNFVDDIIPDDRIPLGNAFDDSVTVVMVSDPDLGDGYFETTATLSVPSGVMVGGLDLGTAVLTFDLSIAGDPFGGGGGAVEPDIDLSASIGGDVIAE